MSIWGAIGQIGAGLLGFGGQERANRTNVQEASRNRQFQSAEAGTQRQFQERMRNTEWQSAVEDMKLAGINPALAYSQGGASSPMGASGSGAQAQLEDAISPGLNSAMAVKRMKQELKNMRSSEELIGRQIVKTRQEVSESRAREENIDALRPGIVSDNAIKALMIPGQSNIANFERGRAGEATSAVRALLRAIQGR